MWQKPQAAQAEHANSRGNSVRNNEGREKKWGLDKGLKEGIEQVTSAMVPASLRKHSKRSNAVFLTGKTLHGPVGMRGEFFSFILKKFISD